jgi:hypothetical protein
LQPIKLEIGKELRKVEDSLKLRFQKENYPLRANRPLTTIKTKNVGKVYNRCITLLNQNLTKKIKVLAFDRRNKKVKFSTESATNVLENFSTIILFFAEQIEI